MENHSADPINIGHQEAKPLTLLSHAAKQRQKLCPTAPLLRVTPNLELVKRSHLWAQFRTICWVALAKSALGTREALKLTGKQG